MQGLIQVPQQVLQGFESDRQPDQLRRHSAARQLLLAQLLVRGRGGMNDQAPRVADVGEMGEELERVDEPAAGRAAIAVGGPEAEREDRPGPARRGTSGRARAPGDPRAPRRPPRPRAGCSRRNAATPSALAACRSIRSDERLEALQQEERVGGREAGARCRAPSRRGPSSGSRSGRRYRRTGGRGTRATDPRSWGRGCSRTARTRARRRRCWCRGRR